MERHPMFMDCKTILLRQQHDLQTQCNPHQNSPTIQQQKDNPTKRWSKYTNVYFFQKIHKWPKNMPNMINIICLQEMQITKMRYHFT